MYKVGCSGKRAYLTERQARNVWKRLKPEKANHVYKCSFYDHWHITTMSKKKSRKVVEHLMKTQQKRSEYLMDIARIKQHYEKISPSR
jgi:hypothetical protein